MKTPTRHLLPWLLAALLIAGAGAGSVLPAAGANPVSPTGNFDYSQPAVFTGKVYAKVAEPKDLLYTFRRTATRSNTTVRVLREFSKPDGTLAAREQVVYESGRLVSSELEEPPLGSHGGVRIQPHPRNPREQIMAFEFVAGKGAGKKTCSAPFQKDTLNNDMIGAFIAARWAELMRGAAIDFHFTAVARMETIGFTLSKESETTWRGQPVVIIKMEASNWIIGQFVDPLRFTVEKADPHRVLQYWGRTTPSVKKGGKWEDLDALTVFDWK